MSDDTTITRRLMLQNFDEARPAFLAALDQAAAELRGGTASLPGFHKESIIQGAMAFSDLGMVQRQLADLDPDLVASIDEEQLNWMHIVILSYLLSLMINENARTRQETTE